MKVTILICPVLEGYSVYVLQITDERTRLWSRTYPLADLCIDQLVEYGLATVFDATDFWHSKIHDEGGRHLRHAETDERTLKDVGFEETLRAN